MFSSEQENVAAPIHLLVLNESSPGVEWEFI
jgi:hypothetical protein